MKYVPLDHPDKGFCAFLCSFMRRIFERGVIELIYNSHDIFINHGKNHIYNKL